MRRPAEDGPFHGVDGCRAGWIRATLSRGEVAIAQLATVCELVDDLGLLTLIDMPIGLFPSGRVRPRACDRAARAALGPRRASVFSPPTRAMLRAREHAEVAPLGLSIQAFHLIPKVAEVDRAVTPAIQARLREGHPELAFACLAGGPLTEAKRTPRGRAQRLELLEAALPGVTRAYEDFLGRTRRAEVAPDDVFDAIVLALAARDARDGAALVVPERAVRDRRGLRMEIVGARQADASTPERERPAPGPEDPRRLRVLATVDCIPRGAVATYGQVAEEADLPRRARFVGRCLGELPAGSRVPWWRVLNASGSISPRGDGSSTARQRELLRSEGINFTPAGRVDLRRYRWKP